MALNIKKKERIVDQIQENCKIALSVVIASLSGIKSNAINELRKEARSFKVKINVVPNSLLGRALEKTEYACLSQVCVGQSIVAFSTRKPSDAARIFMNFSKEYENFKIKGAAFEGNFIGLNQIDLLSNLPDYKESVLRLISVLKMSSIGNLINVFRILSNRKIEL